MLEHSTLLRRGFPSPAGIGRIVLDSDGDNDGMADIDEPEAPNYGTIRLENGTLRATHRDYDAGMGLVSCKTNAQGEPVLYEPVCAD